MPSRSTFIAAFIAAYASLVAGQVTGTFPATPLASKTGFSYPSGIPYKVDTDTGLIRGTQVGYNICNSTTENQNSLCQTSIFNSLDDFCLWAPPEMGEEVGSIEGEMVAWCSKPGHGTRLIPAGALTGVQFIKTPAYIQVVGFIDQTKINMLKDDWGGEMDPHGADLRGNPMGGIMFSNAFNGQYVQVVEWHNFMGGNKFCLKACDPANADAPHFCEHIYDRIGCDYNIPNAAKDGVFESCLGDNQDFPGIYTENGEVKTYTQPPESLGAISTMPYQPKVPASSQCTTFSSAAIFTGLPTVSSAPTTTSGASGAANTGLATSRTGSAGATRTGTAGAAGASQTSGAETLFISGVSLMGIVFSALFLA